jgi:hypothetical protein
MPYKKGPRFKIRPVADIKADIRAARNARGAHVRALFFPAGNSIAMPTDDLCEICRYAKAVFPQLERITAELGRQIARGQMQTDEQDP